MCHEAFYRTLHTKMGACNKGRFLKKSVELVRGAKFNKSFSIKIPTIKYTQCINCNKHEGIRDLFLLINGHLGNLFKVYAIMT
jgi:hypothetical protein